ncbi:MAG: zf-HC2 domain-containing protein [Pyrinomonadaceae bacterium]
MECAESLALLSDYREGALDQTNQVAVQSHLAGCPPCKDVFLDLETIVIAAQGLRGEQNINFPDENTLWQRMGVSKRTIH